MKLTKTRRKSIADSEKIVETIKGKLKEKKQEPEKKIDMTRIAKELARRRARVLSREALEEDNEPKHQAGSAKAGSSD